MEALWHSIVNVGILIFSVVLAFVCFLDKKPVFNSILTLVAGLSMYGMHFHTAYSDGVCAFSGSDNLLEHFINAELCIDSHSYEIILAQIAIIAAMLVWLALAWDAVFRKLVAEESQESERKET